MVNLQIQHAAKTSAALKNRRGVRLVVLSCLGMLVLSEAKAQTFITVAGIGDGITDNTRTIQDALDAAKAARSATVFFPRWGSTSNYRVSTVQTGKFYMLSVIDRTDAKYSVNIMCEPGVTITAYFPPTLGGQDPQLMLLDFEGNLVQSTITGCKFDALRDPGTINRYPVAAINIFAGSTQSAQGNAIKGCTFHNFSRMVEASGVAGLFIKDNFFFLDNHDSGTTGSAYLNDPNVGFWCFDNSGAAGGGPCSNVQITGNVYDGCISGNAGTVTNTCGDGFVYGMYRDVVVANNTIRGFSQEGIFVLVDYTPTPPNSPPAILHEIGGKTISNNVVDGSRITGDTLRNGGSYGIRVDADNSVISGNSVSNCKNGLYVYRSKYFIGTTEIVLPLGRAILINSNKVDFTDASPQVAASGISVVGFANADVVGNQFHATSGVTLSTDSFNGLYLSSYAETPSSDNFQIKANSVIFDATPAGGASGIFLQWVAHADVAANTFFHVNTCYQFYNFSSESSPVTSPSVRLLTNRTECTTRKNLSNTLPQVISDQDGFALTGVGDPIVAAASVSPTSYITHLTTTSSTVTTINPPTGFTGSGNGGCLILIADVSTTYSNVGGNIYNSLSSAAGSFVFACYDGGVAKWFLK